MELYNFFILEISQILAKNSKEKTTFQRKLAHPSRIRKDQKHLSDILEFFASYNNPFDVDCSPQLFNLCTGKAKAASKETQHFLLNIRESGKQARNDFIQRCRDDPAAF